VTAVRTPRVVYCATRGTSPQIIASWEAELGEAQAAADEAVRDLMRAYGNGTITVFEMEDGQWYPYLRVTREVIEGDPVPLVGRLP
jgi:hypothetical protein